jgi:5-(carboxyamino)imidazole ribonucleotide synthase
MMTVNPERASVILPGATLGVLGSGQLGRMFALAAARLGYHVHTYSPVSDSPMGQVASREWVGAYDDLDAVRRFAAHVDLVTFEFENVPAKTAAAAAACTTVRPDGGVLHICQNRAREKTFLSARGFPITPFCVVRSLAELRAAIDELGLPCVLKTADAGYDGKGQVRLTSRDELAGAWRTLACEEAVLEAWVEFSCELSVVAARALDGQIAVYRPFENHHERHILDLTLAPARVPEEVLASAEAIAERVLSALDVVGVMCVELFCLRDGRLLINELAPRPHNSAHLTIDAHVCSQFEQHVRAVCGLPLGSARQLQPAAMANVLGELWREGAPPRWAEALAIEGTRLHLYGKRDARSGRKMGHLCALADTVEHARERVLAARAALGA